MAYLHRFWAANNWESSSGGPVKHKELIQILSSLEGTLDAEAEFVHLNNARDDWRQFVAYNTAWNKHELKTLETCFYSNF